MKLNLSDREDIITSKQVVELFGGIYRTTVRVCNLAAQRKLPGVKIPGVGWRFSKKAIQAFIEKQGSDMETPAGRKWI